MTQSGQPSAAIEQTSPAPAPAARPLLQRVMMGGAWSLGGYGLSQVLRLGSNLIMTRLLAQDAFGLMAIAFSLQILLGMVSDLGIGPSIIRSRSGSDPRFVRTEWVTQIGRSVIIAVGMISIAGVIMLLAARGAFPPSSVYADPRLPPFVALIGLSAIIDGLKSVNIFGHERDMNLGPIIGLEIMSQLAGITAMVITALMGAGAYALILGMLVTVLVQTTASHLILRGPSMRFVFDRQDFAEIFGFGKWLIIASVLGFVMQRGDQFIFAAVLDDVRFGIYAIATLWILGAIMLADKIISRVAYPTLAEITRDRPADLTRVYYRMRLPVDLAVAALFCAGLLLIKPIFGILYTDDYALVAQYLIYLLPIILFLPYRILFQVLLADGRSAQFVLLLVGPTLWVIFGVPTIYTLFDARTAIIMSTLAGCMATPAAWYLGGKTIALSWRRELPLALFGILMVVYLAFGTA